MKSEIIATWSLVVFFCVAAGLTACGETPQLKEGLSKVTSVECIDHYGGKQQCKVTLLTTDPTSLYNTKYLQALRPGEEYVPAK